MHPKVGIIMRTKDRPLLLRRALESVLAQSFADWALVIVNDGGESAPIDELVATFQTSACGRITVRHNPVCIGMEAASNLGISGLKCEYLAIHDDDDTWAPDFLKVAVREIERVQAELPSVKAVVSMAHAVFEHIDPVTQEVHLDRMEPYRPSMNQGLVALDALLAANQFAPIQMLFRADAAHEVGLFREDLPVLGDWDFNIRFMLRYDIHIIPEVLAYYHHRLDEQGIYGNSIVAARSRHQTYSQMLRNEWLRRDLVGDTPHGELAYSERFGEIQTMRSTLQEVLVKLESLREEVATVHSSLNRAQLRSDRRMRDGVRRVARWLNAEQPLESAVSAYRFWSRHGSAATVARIRERMSKRA